MAITPISLRKQGISGVRVVRKQDTTVKKHGGNDESRGGEGAARGASGAGNSGHGVKKSNRGLDVDRKEATQRSAAQRTGTALGARKEGRKNKVHGLRNQEDRKANQNNLERGTY